MDNIIERLEEIETYWGRIMSRFPLARITITVDTGGIIHASVSCGVTGIVIEVGSNQSFVHALKLLDNATFDEMVDNEIEKHNEKLDGLD